MNDVYVEWLVKRKSTIKGIMARILSILLIPVCIYIYLFYGIIGLFAEIAACYLAFYVFKWTSVEYEYCYISGELIIDKIMGKFKRKRCVKIDMSTVEVVAPRGHSTLKEYENKKHISKDYSTLTGENEVYVIFYRKDSDLIKVEFEPNEKIIDGMQLQAPRKVFAN